MKVLFLTGRISYVEYPVVPMSGDRVLVTELTK